MRPRRATGLRKVRIERHYPTHAPGSVLIEMGETRVLCTASVSRDVPGFLIDKATGLARSGWITAEYAMLPGSTPGRKDRKIDSRATEIRRLIGRALRAAVDLDKMPGVSITCDCDVLKADGGTRTASITGAFVALADAVTWARKQGWIERDPRNPRRNPIVGPVAAVSVGIVDGKVVLDLDYKLDSAAEVDMNVVMNHRGEYIEVQGTGEHGTFDGEQLNAMLGMARRGIKQLIAAQRKALGQ
ncbi:MAG: ribonuclease PH [Phycisphaerales bacterium]